MSDSDEDTEVEDTGESDHGYRDLIESIRVSNIRVDVKSDIYDYLKQSCDYKRTVEFYEREVEKAKSQQVPVTGTCSHLTSTPIPLQYQVRVSSTRDQPPININVASQDEPDLVDLSDGEHEEADQVIKGHNLTPANITHITQHNKQNKYKDRHDSDEYHDTEEM